MNLQNRLTFKAVVLSTSVTVVQIRSYQSYRGSLYWTGFIKNLKP